MSIVKIFIYSVVLMVVVSLLWIFLPHSQKLQSLEVNTTVFETTEWSNLHTIVPINAVDNFGRANPFDNYTATSNELERDNQRLKTIESIQAGLKKFYDVRGEYPFGSNLNLGSTESKCLSALGWVPESACSLPSNPAANVQYVRNIEADPGIFNYSYTISDDEKNYELIFELETDQLLGAAGRYIASNEGIRYQK